MSVVQVGYVRMLMNQGGRYGMGHFPVTRYKEQWLRVLVSASEIKTFIRENDSKLRRRKK